jgi:flagellar hook protein FlgE
MIAALQNGVEGMQRASDMVDKASLNTANAAAPSNNNPPASKAVSNGDIGQNMVNMMIGHSTYDANAKVVEVAANMLDTIV